MRQESDTDDDEDAKLDQSLWMKKQKKKQEMRRKELLQAKEEAVKIDQWRDANKKNKILKKLEEDNKKQSNADGLN